MNTLLPNNLVIHPNLNRYHCQPYSNLDAKPQDMVGQLLGYELAHPSLYCVSRQMNPSLLKKLKLIAGQL